MIKDLKKIPEFTSIKNHNFFYEVIFKKEEIINIFKELKENELFSFDQLIDITAIDYPSKENRFELKISPYETERLEYYNEMLEEDRRIEELENYSDTSSNSEYDYE